MKSKLKQPVIGDTVIYKVSALDAAAHKMSKTYAGVLVNAEVVEAGPAPLSGVAALDDKLRGRTAYGLRVTSLRPREKDEIFFFTAIYEGHAEGNWRWDDDLIAELSKAMSAVAVEPKTPLELRTSLEGELAKQMNGPMFNTFTVCKPHGEKQPCAKCNPPAPEPILQFFVIETLPPEVMFTAEPFLRLAETIVAELPRNAERTVALRKLLESRDAALRAKTSK